MRLRNAQREEDGREGSVEISKEEKKKETGENKESQPVYYSSNAV